MKLSEIINSLEQEDIINLMEELGSSYTRLNSGQLAFETICHNEPGESHKHKLVYYHESKSFYCFTECSCSYGIIDLIMKVKCLNKGQAISEFYKIMNISVGFTLQQGFEIQKSDNSFIQRFRKKVEEYEILQERDTSVLNKFYPFYPKSWIENDFISIEACRKFNIKFDVYDNRAIIIHKDIKGRCIGIKVRHFQQKDIDAGRKYMPLSHNGELYNYPTSMNLYGIYENLNAIKKFKKIIIFESEKAVMQHYSYYGNDSIAVAISGSAFSDYQFKLLLSLGVENVVIAVDKEFEEINDEKDWKYRLKVKKMFIDKLKPFFNVEIVWDFEGLLEEKMAPTDRGKKIWEKLYEKRLIL